MTRLSLRKFRRNEKGMALLITIMVVSLLIAVTVEYNRDVRQSFFSSATQLESQNLLAIARSGLAVGSALLEADGRTNTYDGLQDAWQNIEAEQLSKLFPRGELGLTVTDLSGRLQINSLVSASGAGSGQGANEYREILMRLLLSGNFDVEGEEQAREIVDALVDWLDQDDEESDFGAESSYYQSLASPYACRNGPVADLAELLLVRGITPRLLYGGDGRPGLADYLTVHGEDGRLNLNTAPVDLVGALHPLMSVEMAETLDDFRLDPMNDELLASVGWYRNVPGFPGDIELPEAVLTVRSSFFMIRSEGRLQEQKRRLTAVVKRTTDNMTVILEKRAE